MRLYRTGTRWCIWRWTITDSEYITRLHLLKTPWFAVCLHWINKPDPEPYMHDHPVSFFSIILRGGYSELRNGIWRNRACFNFIRASLNDVHKIMFVEPGTLTLCLMSSKAREWGFHTERGWVHWREYHYAQRREKSST